MRVLVVSDVHANLAALETVLDDAGDFDTLWSLGDIVGYGPDPEACIARIRSYEHLSIPGNHDWGVLGKLDLDDFNRDARQANLWTREQLSSDAKEYLEELPETRVEGDITMAHGSPRYPIWEYLFYPSTVSLNLEHFDTSVCLVGHTHVPVVYHTRSEEEVEAQPLPEDEPFHPDEGRYIINPGSVGQPRDGDPRAAYMLIDTDSLTFEHRRIAYPIEQTQDRMREAGLPTRLITRLDVGW